MSRKSKAAEFVNEGYSITVTGRHISVTEPMKAYALDKILKIERFTNRIIDVNITMDVQKLEQKVDIVVKIDHTKIKTSASTENMYASIDKAVDRLQEQLRRYRGRLHDYHAKNTPIVDMNVNVVRGSQDEDLLDFNGEIEEETERRLIDQYQPHSIVDREKMPLKILTYDEAIMKMELSNDPFLIFRCEEDMKLKVIYRREEDNNFGIIETET